MFLESLEQLYKGAQLLWNQGYQSRLFSIYRSSSWVISVGNLTWGGTGKTPLVAYLVKQLVAQEKKIAILSRGYGSSIQGKESDEIEWYRQEFDHLPIFVNSDRIVAAKMAEKEGCELLILDDGFQHRRLGRDLDIVVIDATDPFGNGHLIPKGKLREPITNLKRADWIILNKVDLVRKEELQRLKDQIIEVCGENQMSQTFYQPKDELTLIGQGNESLPEKISIESLKGKRVGLIAAIGNPLALSSMIDSLGAQIIERFFKRDHSLYTAEDFKQIAQKQQENGLDYWITTAKDAIKIKQPTIPIYTLEVDLKFIEGEEALWQQINSLS